MAGQGKSILIISALDIWTIGPYEGSQARWYTLKSYAQKGWNVHFITSWRERGFDKEIHSKYRNIHIYRLNLDTLQTYASRTPKLGFFLRAIFWIVFQVSAFFTALKISKKGKIDVIYGYEIYGVPVAKFLSILWEIPVVSRFQGTSLRLFWMQKKFWKLRAWEHVIAFKISTDLIIMTNDGTQGDKVLKYFGIDSRKVRFWINGFNWEDFEKTFDKEKIRKDLDISSKYILTSISRLARWKRIDRTIKALPRIVKNIPDLKFIVIGDGPEKVNLQKLSENLKVDNYIYFAGPVPHKEITKYLAITDIFLSFYDWSNMGNPLMEAMIAGKCIITLNNGDTGTVVKDGVNGILLEESNEKEIINNISQNVIKVLKNNELREKLGRDAEEFAKKNFWTWEERMKVEIQEIERLLDKFKS